MRIDFSRLLIFFIVAFIGQRIIYYFVGMLPIQPLPALVLSDVLVGFLFAYLYYPTELRRGIFRNPNYYRDAGVFALIFLIIDILTIFL
jgi:hypothetical protein